MIAAVGLGIPLVITSMPEFAMFSGGAFGGTVVAALGGGLVLQVVTFAVVSTALLVVVNPIARRHRQQPAAVRTGVDALRGRSAVVLQRIDAAGNGRIKLAGEVWSARALDGAQVFEAGAQVDVVEIDGATAVVV
ncbi:NfeD family protein [Streptomyces capparidis]